jgi:hypothetical protein
MAAPTLHWLVLGVVAAPIAVYIVAGFLRRPRPVERPREGLPNEHRLRLGFAVAWTHPPFVYLSCRLLGLSMLDAIYWTIAVFITIWYVLLIAVAVMVRRRYRSRMSGR